MDNVHNTLSSSLNQRFTGLAIGKSTCTPGHNFEESNCRLVVLGEVNILLIALKQAYNVLNDLDPYRKRASNKRKSRFSSLETNQIPTDPDLEDEEEELLEAFSSGLLSSEHQDSIIIIQYLNLKRLKARLNKNLNVLIDYSYLNPFCELIKKANNGNIIGIAFSSLLKFLNYGLIDYTEASGSAQLISETLLEVRFHVTDSSNDEVVLMRILLLLREIVTRGFTAIKNETIVAMLKTCFRFPFEPNFSKLLCKTAEHALIEMIRTIFMRLHEFEDKPVSSFTINKSEQDIKANSPNVAGSASVSETHADYVNKQGVKFAESSDTNTALSDLNRSQAHYDIQCVYVIFEYVTALLSPTQKLKDKVKDLRVEVGLNLLIVIFETAVLAIGEKQCLMNIVKDELCWNLFLLIQPEKKLIVFWHALRLSTLIFTNLRMQLKYQFEMLLNRLFEIISSKDIEFDFKEVAIDYLFSLEQQIPFFAQEIYINYDCDLYSNNLYEEMIKLFAMICSHKSVNDNQLSYADTQKFSPLQQSALNSLLVNLKSLQKAELMSGVAMHKYIAADKLDKFQHLFNDCINESNTSSESQCNQVKDNDQTENVSSDDQTDQTIEGTYRQKVREQQQYEREHLKSMFKFPDTIQELIKLKERKKLLNKAVDLFNFKPTKGITFLKEHNLIADDYDLALFLRNNNKLDKKNIAELLSNRKNDSILSRFVYSFDFAGLRIDEAMRIFLETFRLPGESPLIEVLMEKFSLHWYMSNNKPFNHEDNAFTLSYGIIMLNTDLHNVNVKNPMSSDAFIRNLRGANNGEDFDPDMLRAIYTGIRDNKIVLPCELQGLVKNHYLWRVMLRKSETPSALYWHAIDNQKSIQTTNVNQSASSITFNDQQIQLSLVNGQIFVLLWRPTLESLSFLFEKIHVNQRSGLLRKILNQGFTSSAFLCALYGHLDDLIASLCKFTVNSAGGPLHQLQNSKSQEAARCLFSITKEYANEIVGSWTNVVEMLINWYRARFLDDIFEIEDFALADKLIKMKRKTNPKLLQRNQMENTSNIFTSVYQFFSGNDTKSDSEGPDSLGSEGHDGSDKRNNPLLSIYSQPLYIIQDSKFFRYESLVGLVNALINVTINDDDEDDIEAFKLELLIQIILLNRDRVSVLWPQISNYLQRVLQLSQDSNVLAERSVSALFRLAIRFTPRKDVLSEPIFQLLSGLIQLNAKVVQKSYTAIALHSFMAQCHTYLNKSSEWTLLNDLLLYVGIGYRSDELIEKCASQSIEILNVQSDGESVVTESEQITNLVRGYTSDSELETGLIRNNSNAASSLPPTPNPYQLLSGKSVGLGRNTGFRIRDVIAYEKCMDCIEILAIEVIPRLVRLNMNDSESQFIIETCVQSIRKYAEASIWMETHHSSQSLHRSTSHHGDNRKKVSAPMRKMGTAGSAFDLHRLMDSDTESDESNQHLLIHNSDEHKSRLIQEHVMRKAQISTSTEASALRLLQLIHDFQSNITVAHVDAKQSPSEDGGASDTLQSQINSNQLNAEQLWNQLWCPLLQANALLCCDARKSVRTSAVACLQRCLLNRDLQSLSASKWENCFNCVLFPLLSSLLQPINMNDMSGMDETRVRLTNLLSKLFLQHLNLLHSLSTFTALWLTLLDYMDRYLRSELSSEMMREAIPESLKNMLLVMQTAKCLEEPLSSITWDRINLFLPQLKHEIVPPVLTNVMMPTNDANAPTTSISSFSSDPINYAISNQMQYNHSSPPVAGHQDQTMANVNVMHAPTHMCSDEHANANANANASQINVEQMQSNYMNVNSSESSSSPAHHAVHNVTGSIVSNELNESNANVNVASGDYSTVYQHVQPLTSVVIGTNVSSSAPQMYQHSYPTIQQHASAYLNQTTSQPMSQPNVQQQQQQQQQQHAHLNYAAHFGHNLQLTGDYRATIGTSASHTTISSIPTCLPLTSTASTVQACSPMMETMGQSVNQLSHGINMSNVPTPMVRHTLAMPEHMYQQIQQQKTYSTLPSTNAYPWPAPGDPKYL